jgi:hypothetical protein
MSPLLGAIDAGFSKLFRSLEQAALSAGLIVWVSCGVGDIVNRVAGHFASAQFLAFFELAILCLHGQAELDQAAGRFRQRRPIGLAFCPLYDEARNTGAARNPVIGSRPVAGCLRLLGFAFIDICNLVQPKRKLKRQLPSCQLATVNLRKLTNQLDKRLMLWPGFAFTKKVSDLDFRGCSAGGLIGLMQDRDAPIGIATKQPPVAVLAAVDLALMIGHKNSRESTNGNLHSFRPQASRSVH